MKFEIKSWINGSVLLSAETESLKLCVEIAVKSGADLSGADLSGANLSGANLSRVTLLRANLSRADLSGANLSGAKLSGANLSRVNLSGANLSRVTLLRANLSRADLSGANLSGAVHAFAQVAFKGHGECGRMLTAVQLKAGRTVSFFCGCFTGDESALRKYIADGDHRYAKTRTLALDTALVLLSENNEVAT